MTDKTKLIKTIYLYLVSIIGLMMIVVPTGSLINLGLKTWVFTKADMYYYDYPQQIACDIPTDQTGVSTTKPSLEDCATLQIKNKDVEQNQRLSNRQRELANNLAFLIVGIPLFSYHWYLARKKDE